MKKIGISTIEIILIIFILIILLFMYNLFGDDITKLKDINENEKREIISLLNLDEFYDEINLEKIEVPLTYKDIYYKIYFNSSTNIDIDNIKANSDLYLNFDKIKDTQYSCTVSNMGKNIDILEEIRTTYSK